MRKDEIQKRLNEVMTKEWQYTKELAKSIGTIEGRVNEIIDSTPEWEIRNTSRYGEPKYHARIKPVHGRRVKSTLQI